MVETIKIYFSYQMNEYKTNTTYNITIDHSTSTTAFIITVM